MTASPKQLLRDPGREFSDPIELVEHPDLSQPDKLELLRQWRLDLIELQQATGENMPSAGTEPGETADKLRRVTKAIAELESKLT